MALAVPLRAAERNRRVAASVLADGLAYQLFLSLLPFGFDRRRALGFLNADNTERAVATGGLPAAISDVLHSLHEDEGENHGPARVFFFFPTKDEGQRLLAAYAAEDAAR